MAKTKIRIGHIAITDHLILGVTKDKLEKSEENFQHLELETVRKTGWNEVDEALCNGEVDGAFLLAPMAMDLFKNGQKIKLVLFGHKNGSIVITNNAAKVADIKDLKGKIFIIPYQLSVHHMLLHKLLTEKGLSIGVGKDVMLDVLAPSQIPDAIRMDDTGELGGFIVAEPYGSQVVSEGLGTEFALSKDLWNDHPCCVLVMKEDVCAKSPDAVKELTDSLVKSGNFIMADTKAASVIGAKFLNQKVDVIERVLTKPVGRIRTDALFPVIEDLAKMQDYMADKMGLLKTKIDLEKLVDTQFAKASGAK